MLENYPANPLLCVVITNYNRCDDLQAAIESVKKQDYPNVEIVVVDNASNDDSRTIVVDRFPDVHLVTLHENVAMYGYSVGFRHAEGTFVFQMDNDSLMPDKSVLSEVVKRFKDGPVDLAVVATRVEEYSGDASTVDALRRLDERRGPINTGGFHAGGVGFRRILLDKVGYYNQDVFLYGSELFLQMKVLSAGYRVSFYPEILMLHKSSTVARSSKGVYYELRNRYWFMRYFASPKQRLRYLPMMILHDAVYSICKKKSRTFFQSVRDGFGPLPASLRQPLRSKNPEFVRKVDEVGSYFCFANLKSRLTNRAR